MSFCSTTLSSFSTDSSILTSEFLLGLLFTIRMLCFAVFQPFGGLLADRYNRKSIMVWTNWAQVVLALSFLLIRGAEDIVWIYVLTGAMMILHGMYVTAERAALPNIVPNWCSVAMFSCAVWLRPVWLLVQEPRYHRAPWPAAFFNRCTRIGRFCE